MTDRVELPCERCGETVAFEAAGDTELAGRSWADGVLRPLCSDCGEATGMTDLKIVPPGGFQ